MEEIEAKLALLYVNKNVDFSNGNNTNVVEEEVIETSPITTFNLDAAPDFSFACSDTLGAILLADRQNRNY